MWRYRHTDEMYHSAVKNRNKDVLYHSDVYLGSTFDDGIYHWKYVKREKRNGKWVYYYSDAEYSNAKNNYNKAQKTYKESEKRLLAANAKSVAAQKSNTSTINDKEKADIALSKAYEQYRSAGKNHVAAEKKYKKIKIKTAPRRIIAKGAVAVGNTLNLAEKHEALAQKIKKTKNKNKKKIDKAKLKVKKILNDIKNR